MVYPVQGSEAKTHTLSSGTSPYRPYKGVPPPPRVKRGSLEISIKGGWGKNVTKQRIHCKYYNSLQHQDVCLNICIIRHRLYRTHTVITFSKYSQISLGGHLKGGENNAETLIGLPAHQCLVIRSLKRCCFGVSIFEAGTVCDWLLLNYEY